MRENLIFRGEALNQGTVELFDHDLDFTYTDPVEALQRENEQLKKEIKVLWECIKEIKRGHSMD